MVHWIPDEAAAGICATDQLGAIFPAENYCANLEVARRQTTLYSTASANPTDSPPARFVITSEYVKFADRTTAHEETPP